MRTWSIGFIWMAAGVAWTTAIIVLVSSCGPSRLAGYQTALDACREKGKDAGSFNVYETCAREADTKFGLKDGGP